MLSNFCFHHVGYATRSIEDTADFFLQLDYVSSNVVYDKNQHVNILLLSKENSPIIELVEMIDEKSPVYNIVNKNGVMPYHICYEVDNIDQAIVSLRKLHFVQLFKPIVAIAFEGRAICYLYNKNVGLIEILQKKIA